jgi:PKD repeat protein
VIVDNFADRLVFSPLAFTFSPNSRFLYAWNTGGFFQWDIEANDIAKSAIRLGGPTYAIEKNGNIYQNNRWVPHGGQLAPDGRIYYMFNWSNYVINNPDEKCPDCGFCYAVDYPVNGCLDGFEIPYSSTPYFPNYRLGPIDGSTCDSLGINNVPLARFRADQPDTSSLLINFKDLTAYEPTNWTWTFGDGNGSNLQHPDHTYSTPGIYQVCMTASNNNGSDTFCRDLDLRTSQTITISKEDDNPIIFPNPNNGFIQIGLPPEVGLLDLEVFDSKGRQIMKQDGIISGQITPIPSKVPGIYFYKIMNEEGKVWSGKLVME